MYLPWAPAFLHCLLMLGAGGLGNTEENGREDRPRLSHAQEGNHLHLPREDEEMQSQLCHELQCKAGS